MDWDYKSTADIVADAAHIIDTAQRSAYRAVNQVLVVRNWFLGKRIAEEEMVGGGRERYGQQIINTLSENLTARYGKGFDRRTLYRCVQFYQMFPEIVTTVRSQSVYVTDKKIVTTARSQSLSEENKTSVQSVATAMSSFLPRNISCICRRRSSCERRSKRRRNSSY